MRVFVIDKRHDEIVCLRNECFGLSLCFLEQRHRVPSFKLIKLTRSSNRCWRTRLNKFYSPEKHE
jgi:hypothetical protein